MLGLLMIAIYVHLSAAGFNQLDEFGRLTPFPFDGGSIHLIGCSNPQYQQRTGGTKINLNITSLSIPDKYNILDEASEMNLYCNNDNVPVDLPKGFISRVTYENCTNKIRKCGSPTNTNTAWYCKLTSKIKSPCREYIAVDNVHHVEDTDDGFKGYLNMCVHQCAPFYFEVAAAPFLQNYERIKADDVLEMKNGSTISIKRCPGCMSNFTGSISCIASVVGLSQVNESFGANSFGMDRVTIDASNLLDKGLVGVECLYNNCSTPFYLISTELKMECIGYGKPPICQAPSWISGTVPVITPVSLGNHTYRCQVNARVCFPNEKVIVLEGILKCNFTVTTQTLEVSSREHTKSILLENDASTSFKDVVKLKPTSIKPQQRSLDWLIILLSPALAAAVIGSGMLWCFLVKNSWYRRLTERDKSESSFSTSNSDSSETNYTTTDTTSLSRSKAKLGKESAILDRKADETAA